MKLPWISRKKVEKERKFQQECKEIMHKDFIETLMDIQRDKDRYEEKLRLAFEIMREGDESSKEKWITDYMLNWRGYGTLL
jgi:hypothetical protein